MTIEQKLKNAKSILEESNKKLEKARSICQNKISEAEKEYNSMYSQYRIDSDNVSKLENELKKENLKSIPNYIWNDDIWQIIDQIGWGTKTTDYDTIRILLNRSYNRNQIEKIREFASEKQDSLYDDIDSEVQNHHLWIGDDGMSDLLWHIVGMGKKKFNSVKKNVDIAISMIQNNQYEESFAYCFHEE